jgi:carbonic anhydrase/acetyltransferase-like protein (isoleucine patch superfamily)
MPDIRSFLDLAPRIAADAWIDESAVVIGDVEVGPQASIWPLCAVRGDIHSIRIGARSNIQDGSVIHVTHDSGYNPGGFPVVIGEEVTVGHKVMLHGCSIGDNCLIGMGSIVLDGAVIESRVILGAGSLVPQGKVLEGGHLYLGSPVKQIRALTDQEQQFLDYVAGNYVKLARQHRDAGQ